MVYTGERVSEGQGHPGSALADAGPLLQAACPASGQRSDTKASNKGLSRPAPLLPVDTRSCPDLHSHPPTHPPLHTGCCRVPHAARRAPAQRRTCAWGGWVGWVWWVGA